MWMFIVALFIVFQIWKQSKCPSTTEWINKRWYTKTFDILLSNKEEPSIDTCYNIYDPQKHCAKWKKADTKTTSCIIPFETFNKGKSIGTVKSLAVAWSWRLEWEVTENSGGNLLEWWKCSKLDWGDGCATV